MTTKTAILNPRAFFAPLGNSELKNKKGKITYPIVDVLIDGLNVSLALEPTVFQFSGICDAPHVSYAFSFIFYLNFKLTNSSVFHLFIVQIRKNNMNKCKKNRNKCMKSIIQGNLQCAAPHSFTLHLNSKLANSSVFHLFTAQIRINSK